MNKELLDSTRRILVIDDNQAIHEDFAKILRRDLDNTTALAEAEAELFGGAAVESAYAGFQIDSAFQGEQGLAMVRQALAEHRPYPLAFIDVRMPPGWDGIETAARIWQVDPNIQIVICTAYSDYSWKQMLAKLGQSDRLIVLKKPFDNIEVLQLADALTQKWQRANDGNRHLATLQGLLRVRTTDRNTVNEKWGIDDQQLIMAAQAATTHVGQQLVLEHELQHALDAGELSVHYQPLFDIGTQNIVSFEALARWQHPEKGWVSPGLFIPVAEESGLILPLGEFVLRTACEQVVCWEREGLAVVPVAVNISGVQLQRQKIVEFVRAILNETTMRPQNLTLELTESALIENLRQHNDELEALRGDGVRIEIDDFGTGYSSLSYLKELPVDAIKIDRSFVREIATNPVDAAIVHAIVVMAHSMKLRVVAEGVETPEQLRVLRGHGCDVAQGFLLSRPLPAEACGKLLPSSGRHPTLALAPQPLATNGKSAAGDKARAIH